MVESEDVKKAEIDRLYKENVSKVYRTALYYVEDHYVAEEIVQEVFLVSLLISDKLVSFSPLHVIM